MRKPIATAPKDGTPIKVFFRPGLNREWADGVVVRWQDHAEMPAGGSWFLMNDIYLTPGPIEWAPVQGGWQ